MRRNLCKSSLKRGCDLLRYITEKGIKENENAETNDIRRADGQAKTKSNRVR